MSACLRCLAGVNQCFHCIPVELKLRSVDPQNLRVSIEQECDRFSSIAGSAQQDASEYLRTAEQARFEIRKQCLAEQASRQEQVPGAAGSGGSTGSGLAIPSSPLPALAILPDHVAQSLKSSAFLELLVLLLNLEWRAGAGSTTTSDPARLVCCITPLAEFDFIE